MAQTLNTTVRARIDSNVKLSAEAILSSIGMDPSDAIFDSILGSNDDTKHQG